MDGGEEGGGVLGVPGGDAAPALEMQEGVLDEVPGLMEFLVVFAHHPAVPFRRDDRLHPLASRLPEDRIAVVSLVGQQILRRDALDQL